MERWRTWHAAMTDALYGGAGFYRCSGAPGRHFHTAAHGGSQWPRAVADLAHRVDDAAGNPADFVIVDVGAGGGELLQALAALTPRHWRLVGVDVAPRPSGLEPRVQWRTELPDSVTGLLLAVELLDVVPVDVVELTGDGLRLVEVADTGAERLGATPTAEDFGWLRRWWPLTAIGDRAEVGAARDAMWRSLCDRIVLGSAVAVDYESVPHRAPAGTLSGYRAGHQVAPVPDGSCDITAHVRFDSLRGPDDVQLAQRDALRQLGVRSNLPEYDGDAAAYLAGLSSAGAVAGLLDPAGLGGFMWLVHSVGTAPPLSADVADREPARPQSKPARRTSAHTSPTRR